MQTLNPQVLNALKDVSQKELQFTQRVIRRVITKKVSIDEAVKMEQFAPGDKVNFLFRGEILQGNVKRVNPQRIKVIERKTNREINVQPDAIQSAQPVVQRVTRQRKANMAEQPKAQKAKVEVKKVARRGRRPANSVQ